MLVAYLGGDPDKPVVVNRLCHGIGRPPGLNSVGGLPGNKCLSGVQSREVGGMRGNWLRFGDSTGQISAQLASAHGAVEMNLGYLTQPRLDGEGAHVARLIGMLKDWANGSNAGATSPAGGAPIIAASVPAGIVVASQDSLALGAANKIDLLCGGDTQLSTGRKLLVRTTEGLSLFAMRLGMKLIAVTGNIRVEARDGDIVLTALKRVQLIGAGPHHPCRTGRRQPRRRAFPGIDAGHR